jgi:hypothetical protein
MWTKLPFLFLVGSVLAAAPATGDEHGALAALPDGVTRRLADLERQAYRVRLDVEAAHARLQSPPLSRDVDRLRRAARALTHQLRGRPATEVMPLLRRLHRLDKTLASLDARIAEPPEPRPRPARAAGAPGSGILTGRVTEAGTGAPISSFVDVYDAGGDFFDSDFTDPNGGYLVSELPTGTYFVRTDSFDFVDELFNDILCDPQCTVTTGTPVLVTDGQTTSGIDFALLPLGTVEGTIVDAATQLPLENVELRLYQTDVGIEFGQSGPEGRYRIEGVHPGTHFLVAEDDFYLDEVFDDIPCQPGCDPEVGTPIVVGPSGHVTGVDFALRQGGSISGTMTEAGTGEPLFGSVDVFDSSGQFVDSAFTGATGRYQVFDLPAGTYFAVSDTFEYADELYDNLPCNGGCTPTQGTPIAVVAGQERAGTNFVLQRLGALAGRVTTAAGDALGGARVEVYDAQGSFRTSGSTDASGAYQAGGLAAGNHFATADANDYLGELYSNLPCHPSCMPTSGTPIPIVLGGVVPGINFSLDLGGSITGTVRRQANGTPVGDAHIDVFNAAGGSVDHVHPDATGTYVATGLVAGTYFARAEADEFLDELYREIPCIPACPPATSGTPVPVAVAQSTGGVDFTLTRLGRITGRVTATGTGLPVSAQVLLHDSAGQLANVEFTDTGVYLFDNVLPGTYYVRTDSSANFVDELYSNRTCEPNCTVTTGTPVAAALDTTTSGIDFSLRRPVFADVPVTHFAWRYVEAVYNAGVTAGCGGPPLRYCPDAAVSRAQMAVFLLRAKEGPAYLPPPATGLFSDVPAADPFARWIEELVRRQVTGGCAGNPPRYCPNDPTTRAQMAPLLLVTREGPGYLPPPAVGVFSDVPANDPFARWIEELVRRQVTGGCGANPPRYCPGAPTTRAQMAVFLTATFGLPLP